jgi:ATP phosphoribosyltransferase
VTLRIAVPDGALRAPSLEILTAVGVAGGEPATAPSPESTLDARLTVIAADDVPSYLGSGAADAGLVAKDTLLERATGLCELLDLAVVEVVGALDRAVADGLADGVVALIAAAPEGAGQASFAGLAVEGVVAARSVRLVAGRGARVLHTAELGTLVARLRELTAGGDTP